MRYTFLITVTWLFAGCGTGLHHPPLNPPMIDHGLTACDRTGFDSDRQAWIYSCPGVPTCTGLIYEKDDGSVVMHCCDDGSGHC